MAEQLQVGADGTAGTSVDIGAAQVRVRWYVAPGDSATALFRGAAGDVVRRYPGPGTEVVLDGSEWLVDFARLDAGITRVELLVEFTGHRPAGFVATVGHRTLSHPGSTGDADQVRLLARFDRGTAGWTVVPFGQVVLSENAGQHEEPIHHGRLLVLVDSSGSMAGPLADGRVTAAVLDAVRASGRPHVLVQASDGVSVRLRRDAESLQRDIAAFVEELTTRARRSNSEVVALLRAVGADGDDDLVVVTDAPPSDVAAVTAELGDREATWLVVGSAALAGSTTDGRRWAALTASGRVQRRLIGAG